MTAGSLDVAPWVEVSAISHEFALRLAQLAIEKGAAGGLPIAVAVADPAMNLVVYVRANGATPHSAETSKRKAVTAASTRRPTGFLRDELAVGLPLGTDGLITNIQGGVPIFVGDRHLGGLGVAGGTPERDAEIAAAVLLAAGATNSPEER